MASKITEMCKHFLGYYLYPCNDKREVGLMSFFHECLKRFLLWNVDHAYRYIPVAVALKNEGKELRTVLDVGSTSLGVSCYYSGQVVAMDLDFSGPKLRNMIPVVASAAEIPFQDGVFDAVVAIDLLEHMPFEKRQACIRELVRVARKMVIIGFPNGKEARYCDQQYNEIFKKRTGQDHPFLLEHFKYGLPDCVQVIDDLKTALEDLGWKYSLRQENNFDLLRFRKLSGFMAGQGILTYFMQNKLAMLFSPFIMRTRGNDSYRKIIFVYRSI